MKREKALQIASQAVLYAAGKSNTPKFKAADFQEAFDVLRTCRLVERTICDKAMLLLTHNIALLIKGMQTPPDEHFVTRAIRKTELYSEILKGVRPESGADAGKKVSASDLVKLRGDYQKSTVPTECLMLVASADYHKSKTRQIVRIDYEVRGFGYGLHNWLIESGSLPSFDKLDEVVFANAFPWADGTTHEKKPWLPVVLLLIDSGYEPDDVYKYCLRRRGLAIPSKGYLTVQSKPLRLSNLEEATLNRLTANQAKRYRGMQLVNVDTVFFKNLVTGWVETQYDDAGDVVLGPLTSFYQKIPDYYLREFSNEQKVKVRDSAGNVKFIWKPIAVGAPTHSLDTAVLCAAAAWLRGAQYWQEGKDTFVPAVAKQSSEILNGVRPESGKDAGPGVRVGVGVKCDAEVTEKLPRIDDEDMPPMPPAPENIEK